MKNIVITEEQLKVLLESQAEIDRILDKISDEGMDSLTIDEKKYLDAFSKHEGHADDFVSPEQKRDMEHEKKGKKIQTWIPQLEGVEFVYEDSLDDEETKQIAGDLYLDDKTFYLMFEMNSKGKLMDYSASMDYMGNEDDLINYLIEKNPNMSYDDVDGLLRYYIQSEIIPNLP